MLTDICVDMLAGALIDTDNISKVLAQKQPASYWGTPIYGTPHMFKAAGFLYQSGRSQWRARSLSFAGAADWQSNLIL